VLTLAMPFVFVDQLGKRMHAVAIEREKIRQRERDRMAQENQKGKLRQSPQQYVQTIVDRFNLSKWVGQEEARLKLVQAGYRGQAPYITYLFVRMVTPVACFLFALMYLFFILKFDQPNMIKLGICIGAAYVGMQLPLVLLKNKIQRRQLSIKRAFPDTLDLLLICVESGMSIEAAFRKVSDEVGTQSVALAEELTLTTAELSYLPDRRQAYENLAKRTNLDGVKSVCMALQQSERYGTPLGTMLRVMAQENRDMRMSEAEKKAAGLPPKLTVPMILFFLPVLFVVILGPAVIKVMALQ
jgi:tight adherence protein C